jgi:uncharacterized membrane protein YgdD (TMEM256/DUF423 family)
MTRNGGSLRMNQERIFFTVGSLLAGLAVAAGAFGAHGLRGRIDAELLSAFDTGARYQMSHALGLLAVAWALSRWPAARLAPGGWLLFAGTLVFSGSLYVMALTGARWLGAITPMGGVLLLIGWSTVAWRTWSAAARSPTASADDH